MESVRSPGGTGTRYWNAFGLQNPEITSSLSVTVEANPPLQAANARVGGILGRDGDGPLVLLHRSNIGGGTAGVGKELSWREFAGGTKFVYDGADSFDCAVVATLGERTLVMEIARFAEAVSRMKAGAKDDSDRSPRRNSSRCRRTASRPSTARSIDRRRAPMDDRCAVDHTPNREGAPTEAAPSQCMRARREAHK